ncbi:MAG: hypothetical protein D6744_09025 [Planctomycetota bacterium]|nr:MAG: hypothetical protein D6744_09025 [Planctomycetota bacterium]
MLTAWALLLSPVLCAGGVLVHECSQCQAVQPCSHEAGCAEDPCAVVVTSRAGSVQASLDLAAAAVAIESAIIVDNLDSDGAWPTSAIANRAHPSRYPDSGLPLLN